jgi:hypothetical protein
MFHPRCIAHKNTNHQPIGQLAHQDVPQPLKLQHDAPQHVSQEEEPFVIKLVVPGSPATQGTLAEEPQQQQEDHNIDNEGKDDEEYSPLSDTEVEKLYRDAVEMESFGAEASVPTGRLHPLLVHLCITTAPRYRIKEISCTGRVEFKAVAEIFSRSRVSAGTRGQPLERLVMTLWLTPPGRPSLFGVIATRTSCRTLFSTYYLTGRRISSRSLG